MDVQVKAIRNDDPTIFNDQVTIPMFFDFGCTESALKFPLKELRVNISDDYDSLELPTVSIPGQDLSVCGVFTVTQLTLFDFVSQNPLNDQLFRV